MSQVSALKGRWVTISGRRVFISNDGEVTNPVYFNAKRSREKYKKHRKEFGKISIEQYVKRAYDLSNRKSKDIKEIKLKDGRHYKYDTKTNEFLLVENNRVTTFFKPASGTAYWERKLKEYKELMVT